MSELKQHMYDSAKSLLFTALFCVAIAFATQTIWPSKLQEHLAISFGYGFSAVIAAHLIALLKPNWSSRQVNLFAVSSSMVIGTLNAYWWLSKYPKFSHFSAMKPVIVLGFIFTVVCFVYFYAHEQRLLAEKALETAKRKQSEQDKALLMSQLKQLQSQIEPHFLFNTLANIQALIDTAPQDAKQMLNRLTELLRATLNTTRSQQGSLNNELALLEAYLGIQKIRLGDRLDYVIDNRCGDNDLMLPPLLIQPLVENAIQHGIEPQPRGGAVTVTVTENAQRLMIEVSDSGAGLGTFPDTCGSGLGLTNIRQRLMALYGEQARLIIQESPGNGVTARITIAIEELTQGEADVGDCDHCG
ncbi:sensor histidine kinase [Vibrio proteolyticus]|uniref:Putative two-component histidine kinase n=1 Tax=Vibrio proteolyticus NBRC 13287 TaxID=1219065 RepID=U3BEQ0_VIBPR|nr:histidine kinase [Vibrio proteolyticus]GAD68194.1 putative two-component histidine kinase [Vibrio proteolyticus NBRC 13287]